MLNLQKFLDKYYKKDDYIILACSTWPDSMFLLYKLLETSFRDRIVACYFNHKTRAWTDVEEEFIEKLWKEKWFKVEVASCDFEKIKKLYPSKSFEELAREKRYQFFDAIMNIYKSKYLFTAHHLDDKIETFFFNLARWTKLSGLVNMTEENWGILRPLLGITKVEIEKYLKENNLEYNIDETNFDTKYTRNHLRHNIIPQFERVNSSYKQNIGATISYFEELKSFVDDEVERFLAPPQPLLIKEEKPLTWILSPYQEKGVTNCSSFSWEGERIQDRGIAKGGKLGNMRNFNIEKFNNLSKFLQKEVIRYIYYISNGKSTIWLSMANIDEIIRFINWKNNRTVKEIKRLKMRKNNKVIEY